MKKSLLFFILILVCVVSGLSQADKRVKSEKPTKTEKKFIKPKDVFPANGYSHAISVSGGRTIYISGQIALNEKGELVGKDDVRAQTEQIFKNIEAVLKASEASFADVVKINYFIKNFNPALLPAIREVRDRFLPKEQPPPASSLVGVESLFRPDILIEIECIAVVK